MRLSRVYYLVVRAIGRAPPEEPNAGVELPGVLWTSGFASPIVYYVGHAKAPETSDGHPVLVSADIALRVHRADPLIDMRVPR